MTVLRYGNTSNFLVPGTFAALLVDTGYAGTLHAFYRALKQAGYTVDRIGFVLATHWHPDHAGLIGELTKQGVRLLLIDVQKEYVHCSDGLFARDRLPYTPPDESKAEVISCRESRAFLSGIGIKGEIIHTPSHSPDSVSLILDEGDCAVGDLEPYEHIEAYPDNAALKNDWQRILSFGPRRIFFAHRPERIISD